ncbi:hypothetical protein ScalyP_jg1269 [Parmales sp. scaly parma]|nr:hypothetical protein ScalyP_jg1269 [Parmales sp. scaly parma]
MVSFDYDVDVAHRKNQPKFCGMIPDDNGARGRSFFLMTAISALHNISRSVGCAMMMTGDRTLFVWLIGGELTVHFIVKIVRGEYLCFFRVEGPPGYLMSFIWHLMTKVIGDFSGVWL